jgi:hypothetical protein
VRIQKYLFGLRDAAGYVCKIWIMPATLLFSRSKFVALLCLSAFLPTMISSVAQAQRARGGGPPEAQAQPASDAKPAGGDAKPAAPDAKSGATPGMAVTLPPLPPDAHAEQSIQMEGKTLHYTVTVGTLPVRDSKGALSGEVVYTSYIVEGKDRPVTFAFNGGPGAASVYLNLGDADGQSGDVARLYGYCVYRSDWNRLFAVAGAVG